MVLPSDCTRIKYRPAENLAAFNFTCLPCEVCDSSNWPLRSIEVVGFNIGVEIGQFIALVAVLILITAWRRHPSFLKFSTITNTALMAAGFLLLGFQLTGYFSS